MCRGLWYQVSCVSAQVDACFHTICWRRSSVAHFEANPLPHPPLPPFVFPFSVFQWKKAGICQNLSSLLSGLSTFFFFLGGLLRKFTHPWHHSGSKKKKKKSKQLEAEVLSFLMRQFMGCHHVFPVFTSRRRVHTDVNHVIAILKLFEVLTCN